jgi:hypothetical protein
MFRRPTTIPLLSSLPLSRQSINLHQQAPTTEARMMICM